MYFLEERIDALLGPTRSRGVNRMWHCPLHEDRVPSLSVNLETGLWHCFSCGKSGNYESLCKVFGEIPDQEYRWEAARRSVEDGFREPQSLKYPDDFSGEQSTIESHRYDKSFFAPRGIDKVVAVHKYRVREIEGRLSFPYTDSSGDKVRGIKYRDQEGKKWAEKGSDFSLPFGIQHAVGYGDVFIFEGESDALLGATRLEKANVGVCGTSGVSVSDAQWVSNGLHLMFARRIFLVYDADEPGDNCAASAMRVLGDDKCIRMRPTRGKDFTEHMIAGGTMREMMQ